MIDIALRKIGIYYKDIKWGQRCFDKIVSEIPKGMIDRVNRNEMYCHLVNGDSIKAIYAGEGARGYKFTSAYCSR